MSRSRHLREKYKTSGTHQLKSLIPDKKVRSALYSNLFRLNRGEKTTLGDVEAALRPFESSVVPRQLVATRKYLYVTAKDKLERMYQNETRKNTAESRSYTSFTKYFDVLPKEYLLRHSYVRRLSPSHLPRSFDERLWPKLKPTPVSVEEMNRPHGISSRKHRLKQDLAHSLNQYIEQFLSTTPACQYEVTLCSGSPDETKAFYPANLSLISNYKGMVNVLEAHPDFLRLPQNSLDVPIELLDADSNPYKQALLHDLTIEGSFNPATQYCRFHLPHAACMTNCLSLHRNMDVIPVQNNRKVKDEFLEAYNTDIMLVQGSVVTLSRGVQLRALINLPDVEQPLILWIVGRSFDHVLGKLRKCSVVRSINFVARERIMEDAKAGINLLARYRSGDVSMNQLTQRELVHMTAAINRELQHFLEQMDVSADMAGERMLA